MSSRTEPLDWLSLATARACWPPAEILFSSFDVGRLESGVSGAELGDIPEGSGASTVYVALTSDDRLLFASDEGANRLTVSDFQRGLREGFGPRVILGRIPQGLAPVGLAPVGLAFSPDGTRLYATSQQAGASAFAERCPAEGGGGQIHREGAISVIDVAKAAADPTHALITAMPAGCNPVRVAMSPDGSTAWVTARGDNAVYEISLPSSAGSPARRTRHTVGSAPVGVAIQPSSNRVWVSNSNRFSKANGDVQAVLDNSSPAPRIASGRFPRDLRFLPDGKTLVIAVAGSQTVQLAPTP